MSSVTYYRRKEQGICVQCGKAEAIKGMVMCEPCRVKILEDRRKDRKLFKELKICPRCRKTKLFGDEKSCPECLAKMYEIRHINYDKEKTSQYNHEYYLKEKERLLSEGICVWCRKRPLVPGKIHCEHCLAKKRQRYRRDAAKKDDRNFIKRSERVANGLCYFCADPLEDGLKTCRKCADRIRKSLPTNSGGKNKYWLQDNQVIFRKKEK